MGGKPIQKYLSFEHFATCQMSNLVAALERIADALEELVEQGKFDPVQAAIDEANNYTDLI